MIQAALVEKLETYKKQSDYSRLANLLTHSLTANSKEINQATFGYIPRLFREIKIENPAQGIQPNHIFIGEPVIYRLTFPNQLTMGGIPFFYLFCYLKPDSKKLNVYFQSAAKSSTVLSQTDYNLERNKIKFEGINAAFQEQHSAICISDPGHFLPNLTSSFYVGTDKLNFTQLIATVVESLCRGSQVSLHNTLLFGSAAGAMGALLTSTYFSRKVQVLSINSQVYNYGLSQVMNTLLGTDDRQTLLAKFGDRVCCKQRFQGDISSVPNIYLAANVNDKLHQRNFDFYQLYQKLFAGKDKQNQSIFDSYNGVPGQGRPNEEILKKKLRIAREILTLGMEVTNQSLGQKPSTHHAPSKSSKPFKSSVNQSAPTAAKFAKVKLRRQYIEKAVKIREAEILEIGAFDKPTFTKGEANIYYCDYFSKTELAQNHHDIKPQRAKNAVEVDYVVKQGSYSENINKKFDLIIANHVIEHISNMIKWLQDLALILKPDGLLFLTVPHKEYTFDKLRSVTTLDEFMLNHQQNLTAPNLQQITDQLFYHRPVKGEDVWNDNYLHLLTKQRFPNLDSARQEAQRRLDNNPYVDTHCNVFTYDSFVEVIKQLSATKQISLKLDTANDVIKPHNEFHVILRN